MAIDSVQLMMRYNQLWRGPQELARAHEVLAEGFVRRGTSGRFQGIPAFKRYVEHFTHAFPDLRLSTEDWVRDGGKLAVRYRLSGTHRAPFLGIAPTGAPVRAEGVAIYRIEDGRIQELWDFLDMITFVLDFLPFSLQEDI